MSLSYYEVYITSLRAFTGMGFPYGADEDAAYMVSWLELNKLNGVKMLAKTFQNFDNQYEGKINFNEINATTIDIKNTSLLMKGPGLFDYCEAQLQKSNNISVSLTNCIDPYYLLPLMFKLSKKINFCSAWWDNKEKNNVLCEAQKNFLKFGTAPNLKIKNKNQVELFFSKENKKLNNYRDITKKITIKTIQDNLESALSPGNKDWRIISKLAQRTFVPESVESRIMGAGGGDAND